MLTINKHAGKSHQNNSASDTIKGERPIGNTKNEINLASNQ